MKQPVSHRRSPRNRGFSIAELTVAMTVLGLLALFIVPFYVAMLRVAYKTSGVLNNTDALREFSTRFAGDVQSASNFNLINSSGQPIASVVDGGTNNLQLAYVDPRTNNVLRIVGYYIDGSQGGEKGPWPVRRYEVTGSTAPDLSEEDVRERHPVLARVTPVQSGQLFYRLAGVRTVFVNANVITTANENDTSGLAKTRRAINSLRLAISLR